MNRAIIDKPKGNIRTKTKVAPLRTFRSTITFLNSLTNYEALLRAPYDSTTFGLTRITRLLSAMGNPHRTFRTAHVAGTKGKGSTCSMLAAMLQAAGLRVGLYTSPHVLDIRERIVIDNEMISESAFTKAVATVAAAAKARHLQPTYFEVLTAAAFHHFSTEGVDIAVIETGLGGRLDATNVVSPDVVGITSISHDHMAQLGSDIASIAAEKAGIMKKGVPVISVPQRANVKEVLRRSAEEVDAPLRFADEDVDFSYRFEFTRSIGRHARICLTTPTSRFEHVHVPLLGEHQAINCGLALTMLDALKARGMPIDEQQAVTGLANVKMLGRMQMIAEAPRILVDGAHNAASIDALMRAIGQNITYDSMVLIFGCNKDKDIVGMIRRIQLGADKVIFTPTDSPRTADPNQLAAEYIERSGGKAAQVARNLDEAMRIALSAVTREDLVCITGSFYLVAEALRKYGVKHA